jgi:FkbH-like protein
MTQKTNQFNLTTKRYTETQITNMLDNDFVIWDAQISDKFGDSGITALAIIKVEKTTAIIDSFLLSCRILGRGIETAFLNYILNQLFEKGVKSITSSFFPTAKNMQVAGFYEGNGFILVTTSRTMQKIYKLELTKKRIASNLYDIR